MPRLERDRAGRHRAGALHEGVCLTHDERVRFNELARSILKVEAAESPTVAFEIPDQATAAPKVSWWRRYWRRARGRPDVR